MGVSVTDMKKFTKAHALRLYNVLVQQRREATIKKMIENCPKNYNLINDYPSFVKLLELLDKEDIIAVDTENTGLDYIDNPNIVGISLTLPQGTLRQQNHRTTESDSFWEEVIRRWAGCLRFSEKIRKYILTSRTV
ncbi:hypothetical protein HW35_09375 [Bacillus sp. X1(2014)]|nr:hypothetical protein HW35_09375 [Bacillus sp. X1(2014)]